MVLVSFLVSLALVAASLALAIARAVGLWRQAARTGDSFSAAFDTFEERAARTERLLEEAERSSRELEAALERLRTSQARMQVLRDAVAAATRRTRWLRPFLPV